MRRLYDRLLDLSYYLDGFAQLAESLDAYADNPRRKWLAGAADRSLSFSEPNGQALLERVYDHCILTVVPEEHRR